jgi:transcription-repair coupling factor (superfamily II helicase)
LSGNNDVLIGTHALLYNDNYINNIGLLIIDEEHRFGVKQKEFVKNCRTGVDVLSLSATPIPRSMNLVLSDIYSISMLQTPPLFRRPIYTRVEFYNDALIRSAIVFELGRGGQVYFIHNDIQTIEGVVFNLRSFFPDRNIVFIHGQQQAAKIEKTMSLFVSGKIDVLVCTSIVESGIDVPATNCIIINNAHLFGLSQLYQMRGRVGRGRLQAYAYLLIPNNISLSDIAYKRIKTIEQNTSLGSGYSVAHSDMEIRGSGDLFGYKQSGGSGSVGYELYARLVQGAIHKSVDSSPGEWIRPEEVDVRFFSKRFIPEEYINSEEIRLSIYKSLSLAFDRDSLDELTYSLINRFGALPLPVKSLINESRLRAGLSRESLSKARERLLYIDSLISSELIYSSGIKRFEKNRTSTSSGRIHSPGLESTDLCIAP